MSSKLMHNAIFQSVDDVSRSDSREAMSNDNGCSTFPCLHNYPNKLFNIVIQKKYISLFMLSWKFMFKNMCERK